MWTLLALLLMTPGAGLVLLGVRFRSKIAGFNRRAVTTAGMVIGHAPFTATHGAVLEQMTEARIQFRTQQGQVVETKGFSRRAMHPPQPPVGSSVSVLYDPADPREASTTGPRGQAGVANAIFWMGCLLCAAGLAVAAVPLASRLF